MTLKFFTSITFVFVLLFATACFATEPEKEIAGSWIHIEGRVYKNDIQVSKPTLTVMSNHPIDMATEAKDEHGSTSFILINMTPTVVNKDKIKVKGEISIAFEEGAKPKMVTQISRTIEKGEVIKIPVNLKEDKYSFEFKFSIVKQNI